MCFGYFYPFTYVMESNIKLAILKLRPQLHLLFQSSPTEPKSQFIFFFIKCFPYLIKGGVVGKVGRPSGQLKSSRAVMSVKELVPSRSYLRVLLTELAMVVAGW